MRIIFFGTGAFGIPSLKKIVKSGHDLAAVVTQPDRMRGRGWNVIPTAVKAHIQSTVPGMEILQPGKASDPDFLRIIEGKRAEIFVVIDYGQILVRRLMDMASKCCINLHPSLLPAYRGAAPINYAILNGEKKTGATVIRMDEKMDAGDIILQSETVINDSETAVDLGERLSQAGSELVMRSLELLEGEGVKYTEQDEGKVSYAPRLKKTDGKIDWGEPAEFISRKVRAMQPWPGAYTSYKNKGLKIQQAVIIDDKSAGGGYPPGAVMDEKNLIVKAGRGCIKIVSLQPEGKRRMTAEEFRRGHDIPLGATLGEQGN